MNPIIDDIPNYCRGHIEEVGRVSNRLAALEATQGKIVLSSGGMMLVWVVTLAIIAAAASSAVSAYQATEAIAEVRTLSKQVNEHTALPWHPAAGHRYDELDNRINKLEQRR